MPSFMGATSPIIALAATAASIAFPPRSRIDAATCDASTLSVATTPSCDDTIDRDCERSCACNDAGSSASTHAAMRAVETRFIKRLSEE